MSQRSNAENLPPEEYRDFVIRVATADLPPRHRQWTGNDKSARNHNGAVRFRESPLFIRLFWKETPTSSIKEIGSFKLNLSLLASENYVRTLDNQTLKLRFYHAKDGRIYIQRGHRWRGIPIGEFD